MKAILIYIAYVNQKSSFKKLSSKGMNRSRDIIKLREVFCIYIFLNLFAYLSHFFMR